MLLPTSSLQSLATNQIDLWSIAPSQLTENTIILLSNLLSNEESLKLQQYKNKSAQHTSLVTRSLSRLILSQYTNTEPHSLSFMRNAHGKPSLVDNINNLSFNLSHNNDLLIMAICVNDNIGCDIENPIRKISIEPISRRYFSQQEHQQLCELIGEAKKQRFFEIWTLKEAFVKATGVGISLGLDTFYFDKSVLKNNISILFNVNYPRDQNESWQFHQQPLSFLPIKGKEERLLDIKRNTNKLNNPSI